MQSAEEAIIGQQHGINLDCLWVDVRREALPVPKGILQIHWLPDTTDSYNDGLRMVAELCDCKGIMYFEAECGGHLYGDQRLPGAVRHILWRGARGNAHVRR